MNKPVVAWTNPVCLYTIFVDTTPQVSQPIKQASSPSEDAIKKRLGFYVFPFVQSVEWKKKGECTIRLEESALFKRAWNERKFVLVLELPFGTPVQAGVGWADNDSLVVYLHNLKGEPEDCGFSLEFYGEP